MPGIPQDYPVSLLDYALPEELIAQQPLAERDSSRLLVANRAAGNVEHRKFRELPGLLPKRSFLVLNDSRVMRSRYFCTRVDTGGRVEVLLTRVFDDGTAECLTEARGHIQKGERLAFSDGVEFEVLRPTGRDAPGRVRILQSGETPDVPRLREILEVGVLPLPPYLKENLSDEERYQTSFAAKTGSSAAPTAGLHFTQRTFDELKRRGIGHARITLHVGTATFLPIRGDDAAKHHLAPEPYSISLPELKRILAAKLDGMPIVAVGTTSIRVLERVFAGWRAACNELGVSSAKDLENVLDAALAERFHAAGETDLYVLPGYKFKFVDALLTNFHLPRTTLLALVYAFAGRELVRRAYDEAIARRYRFYSLGDAMLVV